MSQKVYLIGICGVAMATLAVMLKQKGFEVSGSDKQAFAPMTGYLAKNTIPVFTPYHVKNLNQKPDFVVIGNSQSRGNSEVEFVLENRIPYFSMPETIKNHFLQGNLPLVVTGTHGKTTVTTLISYLLFKLGEPIGVFVGGASNHFEDFGRACKRQGEIFVIEGDEYDTSFFDKKSKFFHYFPHYLIINNIELDHIDIFRSEQEIVQSFCFLTRQVPANGAIFANYDDQNVKNATSQIYTKLISFGQVSKVDYQICDIEFSQKQKCTFFSLKNKKKLWNICTPLLGTMNVYNTTAAILCCLRLGYPMAAIQKHLLTFNNAKRRLELKTTQEKAIVYDDFAHHPTAIKQSLNSIRNFYPKHQIFAIYEPRSNTSIHKIYENILAQSFLQANHILFFKSTKLQNFDKTQRLNLDIVCQRLQQEQKTALCFTEIKELASFLKNSIAQPCVFLFFTQGFLGDLPTTLGKFADEKYG